MRACDKKALSMVEYWRTLSLSLVQVCICLGKRSSDSERFCSKMSRASVVGLDAWVPLWVDENTGATLASVTSMCLWRELCLVKKVCKGISTSSKTSRILAGSRYKSVKTKV